MHTYIYYLYIHIICIHFGACESACIHRICFLNLRYLESTYYCILLFFDHETNIHGMPQPKKNVSKKAGAHDWHHLWDVAKQNYCCQYLGPKKKLMLLGDEAKSPCIIDVLFGRWHLLHVYFAIIFDIYDIHSNFRRLVAYLCVYFTFIIIHFSFVDMLLHPWSTSISSWFWTCQCFVGHVYVFPGMLFQGVKLM